MKEQHMPVATIGVAGLAVGAEAEIGRNQPSWRRSAPLSARSASSTALATAVPAQMASQTIDIRMIRRIAARSLPQEWRHEHGDEALEAEAMIRRNELHEQPEPQ
jgi:hypothetical protein